MTTKPTFAQVSALMAEMHLSAKAKGESLVHIIGGQAFQAKRHGSQVWFYFDGKHFARDSVHGWMVKAMDAEQGAQAVENAAIDDLFEDGSQMAQRPLSAPTVHGGIVGHRGGYFSQGIEYRMGEGEAVVVLAEDAKIDIPALNVPKTRVVIVGDSETQAARDFIGAIGIIGRTIASAYSPAVIRAKIVTDRATLAQKKAEDKRYRRMLKLQSDMWRSIKNNAAWFAIDDNVPLRLQGVARLNPFYVARPGEQV